MLQCNTLMRKVDFLVPDQLEIHCIGMEAIVSNLVYWNRVGIVHHFFLEPGDMLFMPLCSHGQA